MVNQQQDNDQVQIGLPVQDQVISAADVNLKGKHAFYEIMVRAGYFLPKETSKFINQKMLQLIRNKKVFSAM